MTSLFVQFPIIIGTALIFVAINGFNEWMISQFGFIPGMTWISLSAGMCVLATLLLGLIGTVGIFLAHVLLFLPHSTSGQLSDAILSALAHVTGPYLVYLIAERVYRLQASLENLTSSRLLLLITICSAACPVLQSLYMKVPGSTFEILMHYLLMSAGNLVGALIFTYLFKAISAILP